MHWAARWRLVYRERKTRHHYGIGGVLGSLENYPVSHGKKKNWNNSLQWYNCKEARRERTMISRISKIRWKYARSLIYNVSIWPRAATWYQLSTFWQWFPQLSMSNNWLDSVHSTCISEWSSSSLLTSISLFNSISLKRKRLVLPKASPWCALQQHKQGQLGNSL